LQILFAAVVSTAWAETKNIERPVRAPQGQIRYDTDATRADWKYLTPQEQWRSRVVGNIQRIQRAESGHRQRQNQRAVPHQQQQQQQQLQRVQSPQPVQQAQQQVPGPQYYSYKPYTAVPSHIKELIQSAYQPQPPYIDPSSFLYSSYVAPQQYEQQQPASAASELPQAAYQKPSARYQSIDPRRVQSRREYSDRRVERQDRVYGDEYAQQQQQQEQQQVPIGTMPEPPLPTLYLDRNMPSAIKQLLQYQAQIPYDVTANRIQYTPKNVFIPRPLADDAKGPYYYRSKVYYPNEGGEEADYPQDHKPVDEQQRH
ncbi:adenylate cyclase, terminal-differentiation specific, partial [Ooceraea biroi]|uniref:adenylate cyclase, terminal-differentiation specific n=1 Tax=Ooceraea biroi TaxID=2015173 RepID=UPI000F0936C8